MANAEKEETARTEEAVEEENTEAEVAIEVAEEEVAEEESIDSEKMLRASLSSRPEAKKTREAAEEVAEAGEEEVTVREEPSEEMVRDLEVIEEAEEKDPLEEETRVKKDLLLNRLRPLFLLPQSEQISELPPTL